VQPPNFPQKKQFDQLKAGLEMAFKVWAAFRSESVVNIPTLGVGEVRCVHSEVALPHVD
jgi:hypothetical protein